MSLQQFLTLFKLKLNKPIEMNTLENSGRLHVQILTREPLDIYNLLSVELVRWNSIYNCSFEKMAFDDEYTTGISICNSDVLIEIQNWRDK